MIALSNHVPLIKLRCNKLVPCEVAWLNNRVNRALDHSKIPQPEIDGITSEIQRFLEGSHRGSVIEWDDLLDEITELLAAFGLENEAANFAPTPPVTTIDLAPLAKEAIRYPSNVSDGQASFLYFLSLFESECSTALRNEVDCVECQGLAKSANILRIKKAERPRLKAEVEKIVDETRRIGEVSLPIFTISIES